MKMTAVKKLSAVLLCFIMMFVMGTNVFAETVQDRLEQSLGDASEQFESADPEEQEEMQDAFSSLLENAGLADFIEMTCDTSRSLWTKFKNIFK